MVSGSGAGDVARSKDGRLGKFGEMRWPVWKPYPAMGSVSMILWCVGYRDAGIQQDLYSHLLAIQFTSDAHGVNVNKL
jgi:hypothetical protein